MDFYISDDSSDDSDNIDDDSRNIYENECKINFLYDIKKTLLSYLVNYIINDYGNTKYRNFDIDKYYMNKIITTDIASKYDLYNDNIDTAGNLQSAILKIHGFDFVASYMNDPDFANLSNTLDSNIKNVTNITANTLISVIDDNILYIKNINSSITFNNYILSVSKETNLKNFTKTPHRNSLS